MVLLAVALVKNDEVFENSSKLCQERCNCTQKGLNYFVNCTDRGMKDTLANWPPVVANRTTVLVASFGYNRIRRLKTMPGSELVLKLSYDHCGIEEIESDLFESSAKILFLDLSHNSIEGEPTFRMYAIVAVFSTSSRLPIVPNSSGFVFSFLKLYPSIISVSGS